MFEAHLRPGEMRSLKPSSFLAPTDGGVRSWVTLLFVQAGTARSKTGEEDDTISLDSTMFRGASDNLGVFGSCSTPFILENHLMGGYSHVLFICPMCVDSVYLFFVEWRFERALVVGREESWTTFVCRFGHDTSFSVFGSLWIRTRCVRVHVSSRCVNTSGRFMLSVGREERVECLRVRLCVGVVECLACFLVGCIILFVKNR